MLKFNRLINNIPNVLTLVNIFCGCVAIVSVLRYQNYFNAALMIMIATIADFLDGFIARILDSKSLIGKYLDSLSDIISFGLVPAVFLFIIIEENLSVKNNIFFALFPLTAFFITMFSALRLAVFNTYDNASKAEKFKGLNTTANTIFFISLKFITPNDIGYNTIMKIIKTPILMLIVIFISCLLLISKIPMFSFKINTLSWNKNKDRYHFFIISIICAIFLGRTSIPCIVILYIIYSIIINFLEKQ